MATPNPQQQQPAQQPAQGQDPRVSQAAGLYGLNVQQLLDLLTKVGPLFKEIILALLAGKGQIEAAAQQHVQGTQPKP